MSWVRWTVLGVVCNVAAPRGFTSSACNVRRDVPVSLARYLRSNILQECGGGCECTWTDVEQDMARGVMRRYFHVAVAPHQSCELFLIEGVPAASILFHQTNAHSAPIVDAFHFNLGLLLMFDAGFHMRSKLRRRHPRLDMRHAVGRSVFLLV